jgi:hypothetical protein
MESIEFDANYGGVIKKVKINDVHKGSGGYQILIDNYYQGDIFFKDGQWKAQLNAKSQLTSDDILILGEKIEEAKNNEK